MKKQALFLCPISGLPIREPIIINHSSILPLIYDRSSVEAAIAAGEVEKLGIRRNDFKNILLVDQFSQAILTLIDEGVTSINLSHLKREMNVVNDAPQLVDLRCGIIWEFPKDCGVLCRRDGRTYDKEALESSLQLSSLSPFSKNSINPELDIIVHPIHRRIIAEMRRSESGVVNLETVLDNLEQDPIIYPFRSVRSRPRIILRSYLVGATILRVMVMHGNVLFNILAVYSSAHFSCFQYVTVLCAAMGVSLVDLEFYRTHALKTEKKINETEYFLRALYTLSSIYLFYNFSEIELFKISGFNTTANRIEPLPYRPRDNFLAISKLGKLFIVFSVMPQLFVEISSFRDMIRSSLANSQSSFKDIIKVYFTISALMLFGAASHYGRYYPNPLRIAPSDLLEIFTVTLAGDRIREMIFSPSSQFHRPSIFNIFLLLMVAIATIFTVKDFSLNSCFLYLAPLVVMVSKIFMQSQPLSTDQLPVIRSENQYRFMPKPKLRFDNQNGRQIHYENSSDRLIL